jgi:integrase
MQLKRVVGNPYVIASSHKLASPITRPKKAWTRLLKTAKLEKIRIHDLRHTNASIALQAKVPLEIISKRLGHSSIQTTMRYAHLADDHIRNATDALSDTLGKAMGI